MVDTSPRAFPIVWEAISGNFQFVVPEAGWLNIPVAPVNSMNALTGDVIAAGPASAVATLATVNSNVGSFTSANITVDAKGRVTAASNGSGSAIHSVISAPTISHSGTQSVAVAGLLTTSQIIAVSQNVPGAAGTLSLLGFSCTLNGFLNITYVADPGVGGTVLVSFI